MFGLLFFCLAGNSVGAQTTPMVHYTVEDGLPSNNVYNVYRDSKGYLWFGTDKGVARYNGISFQTFTMGDGLPDNEVLMIREDRQQRLWMVLSNGKLCFYKNGRFYSEKTTPALQLSLKPPVPPNVHVNDDGSVSFCYPIINVIADVSDQGVRLYHLGALTRQYNMELVTVKKRQGNRFTLLGTENRLLIDTQLNVLEYQAYPGKYLFTQDNESNFFMMSDSSIYDCERNYLYPQVFNYSSDFLLSYMKYVLKILPHEQGVFFCTSNGLYTTRTTRLLKDMVVTSAATDVNGNYWVTTYKQGVYVLPYMPDSIVKHTVLADEDMDNIGAFDKTLYYQNTRTQEIYRFSAGKQEVVYPGLMRAYVSSDLYMPDPFIIYGRGHALFLSTHTPFRKNVLVTTVEDGKYYTKVFNQLGEKYNSKYYRDRCFYVSHQNEIGRIYLDSIKSRTYKAYDFVRFVGDEKLGASGLSDDGYLWVSTNKKVYRYANNRMEVQPEFVKMLRRFVFCGNYLVGYDDENVLTVNNISSQHKRQIGSYPGIGRQWQEIYRITATQAIAVTDKSYYLISIDTARDSCTLSILENRFIPLEARYIYADTAHCYFLKDGSVTSMPLHAIQRADRSPALFFTQFRKDGVFMDIDTDRHFNFGKTRDLSIWYDYISFGIKEISCQYSVTQEGDVDSWNDIQGNAINLSSPGYGTYTVKIRIKRPAGVYTTPISLTLTIARPFWLSWWFIAIVVLLSVAFIFIITRSVIMLALRRRKRVYDLESKYHAAEYKTLNALMSPHFIFNSLNNIKGLMNLDDKKAAIRFLNSFSNVVRQNMQNLSRETVSLYEEIQLVSKYLELEKLRFGDIINYEIKMETGIDVEAILIPPLLIQPLAENAVKHGLLPLNAASGLIVVYIYEKGSSLYIEVRDNGVGLSKSDYTEHEGYESLGLANIEKRLLYLRQSGKQQIYFRIVPNEEGPGTVAIIEIRF